MRRAIVFGCLVLMAGTACNDNGDTIIVNADCGLVRSDLEGTWNVTFQSATADLFNCSDPTFNNDTVTVSSSTTFSFNDVEVFASASNVGFQFRNTSSPQEIFGNVESDTCNMLFAFLDNEGQYLQCIGTLDRQAGIVSAACDSTTVLALPLADPPTILADCDLDPILRATLTIN